MLRRLLKSSEPMTVQRLADLMRMGSKFVLEALSKLQAKGLAEATKRGGDTLWAAAPGASVAQLTGGPTGLVGYAGTSSLGQRRLTPSDHDDFDDLTEGFL